MHRKHGIDRGTEVTEASGPGEGIPVGSGVPPSRRKVSQNILPTQLCSHILYATNR